jgi:hypothetical protein
VFPVFCKKPKMLEVSKRRLRWTSRTEAHGAVRAEFRNQRGHAAYQPKVAASALHVVASLDYQNRCLTIIV